MTTKVNRWFVRIAVLALLLCLCVVVFGAFVRLSNAGLSCPDWPTCYGKATWPTHEHEIAAANVAFPQREVEVGKAWLEQFHRHLAAILGVLVLTLALLANWTSRGRRWSIIAAVVMVAVAIGLYMREAHVLASVLAATAELLLVIVAFGSGVRGISRVAILGLALIIFQALLGMWTVTWNLKPVVVMGHLLGGLSTLGLLGWLVFSQIGNGAYARGLRNALLRPTQLARRAVLLVLVVLATQIALGGWVSSNYAALACPDFPTCQGQWWPAADFEEGFVLWRGIGADYEGGVLDAPARTAIHLVHRIGAVIASIFVLALAFAALRDRVTRAAGVALLVLLPLQVALGIGNIVWGLPLHVAVAHNAVAALLVLCFAWLLARPHSGRLAAAGTLSP
jgi:cytochrome c oxidase assembly protein subunit 15